MECVPFSVLPAQAGTQTLAHRREVGHCPSALSGSDLGGRGCILLNPPSPPRGRGPFFIRVIASEAKQPRGLTRTYGDGPLGCFGVSRLAMTQLW